MKNPKAGKRPYKIKHWLGLQRIAPFQTEHNAEGKHLRIFWPRLIIWTLAITIVGWTGMATSAFVYVKYGRKYTTVKFTHLLLFPLKKSEYRKAKCQFLLEKGKAALKEHRFMDAFQDIRLGLMEVPEDTEARVNVAQFYAALKRNDLADKILAEGLPFNLEKKEYVLSYFKFLFGLQRDERVLEVADRILGENIKSKETLHTIKMAKATAYYFRGRYKEAQVALESELRVGAPDARLLSAQIQWQLGNIESALSQLAELSSIRVKESDEIHTVRIGYLRELKRISDIRSICVLRQLEHPDEPQAFIDQVSTLDPNTESMQWSGAVGEVFLRFPGNLKAMYGLAELAAKTGQSELAWRVYRQCKAQNLTWSAAAHAVLLSNLSAGRYNECLSAAQTISDENIAWAKTSGDEFDLIRSVANYGLGDKALADLQLNNYLNSKNRDVAVFIEMANQYIAVGAIESARKLLERAIEANEYNQEALTRLVEIDIEQTDTRTLFANTERLLVMRKPARHVLDDIYQRLQSDRYLFEGRGALLTKISIRLATIER